ncbi:MAG TPA: hypothetical protein VIA18_21305 [Polyangia bacterium]|nr:hypothetical protein [Polyangia bacterium]
MLHKAAKLDARPALEPPTSPAEEVRLWLGVHDSSRIEWTAAIALPDEDERRYQIEFDIDIPATLFPSHNVWEHLQIFTRLRSPAEEGPLAIERDDAEELRRDTLGVAHRLKQLKVRFERACVGAAATTREQPDPGLHDALTNLVTAAFELTAEMRMQLHDGAPNTTGSLGRECQLADEFLSHQLIDLLAGCERALDDVVCAPTSRVRDAEWTEDLRCLIAEGLAEELAHRRGRDYLNPRADVATELAQFIERASRLKKHFQDVLYLDVEAHFMDSRIRYYVMVVAAVVAALMFLAITALPNSPLTRGAVSVGTFLAVFAAAYALRDVIKEAVRGWVTGRLMRLYGQRVVTLKLPHRIDRARRVLVETRETFDVDALSTAFARGDERPEHGIGRPRAVVRLHFRMRATLHPSQPLAEAHIGSIKHIFRYDLSPIFSRLDNAVKQVPVLDAGRRVRFADAPKEYRFPARIAFQPADGERLETRASLVLSKRGIERIEPA